MKINQTQEIENVIRNSGSILLFPHVNMDGDALGSAVALCRGIRNMGKKCFVLLEDEIPGNLKFLDKGYCTSDQNVFSDSDLDLSICIDCGDAGRFEKRKEKFMKANSTVCIDHHQTTEPFCEFNFINPESAATGQLVFRLMKQMNMEIDKETGEAIFAAITTDTGNFKYSNTSKETHQIVSQLYDAGIDANSVCIDLYESIRIEKVRIESAAVSTLDTFADGKGVVAYVTQSMLNDAGASMDETDGVVETLRSINSVEIAAFLKEFDRNLIKVSLRAKRKGNVAEIAAAHNGGGHEKAAGFSLHCSLEQAIETVKNDIRENLKKYDN